MASDYKYGRQKERQVGEFLGRRGWSWSRMPGSRGCFDLVAQKDTYLLLIQVKATRSSSICYTRLSKAEEENLLSVAEEHGAIPMLALVCGNYLWIVTVPDAQDWVKGNLKTLKYTYFDK